MLGTEPSRCLFSDIEKHPFERKRSVTFPCIIRPAVMSPGRLLCGAALHVDSTEARKFSPVDPIGGSAGLVGYCPRNGIRPDKSRRYVSLRIIPARRPLAGSAIVANYRRIRRRFYRSRRFIRERN